MSKHIWYVMLNVGGGRECQRSEIPDQLIEMLTPLLESDGLKESPFPGIQMIVTPIATALQVSFVTAEGVLATCAVALRDRNSDQHWRSLHETRSALATQPAKAPSAPWVGLAIEDRTRDMPREIVHGIIGLTKACAWTWLEMRGRANA